MPRKSKKATVLGATSNDESQQKFEVSSYTLNRIDETIFPGNIAPEGYFYAPFYEVRLKELNDELNYVNVKRINYDPTNATISSADIDIYNPEIGATKRGTIWTITIVSPVPYNLIQGQPFVIYDVLEDSTYRGYLSDSQPENWTTISISTESELQSDGLGDGRYIISLLPENAPVYAEYIPSTERVIWRGLKKMSELNSDSPLYNMPFTNGRHYIHQNINVFVRRQDPNNEYHLLYPSFKNPLRRYQIEGNPQLDFDDIDYIINSLTDAC